MEELRKRVAAMAPRLTEAQNVCSSESEYEAWTRAFVCDLVKITMPDFICEVRKRENPQEELKEQATFKEELDLISAQMSEFLSDIEHEHNSQIQKSQTKIKAVLLMQQQISSCFRASKT